MKRLAKNQFLHWMERNFLAIFVLAVMGYVALVAIVSKLLH